MISDPYSVLGIPRSASPEDIKKAYRKKAKEYHPDLHPNDPNAVRKMNEVNEAYDMLTNPGKYANANQQSTSGYGSSGYGSSYGSSYGGSSYGSSSYGSYGSSGYNQNGQSSQQQGYQGAGGWYSDFNGFDFGDLFGFGFGGTADTSPTDDPSDNADLRAVVQLLRQKNYNAAATKLTSIPSTMRRARWYYLYALADHGLGDNARAIDHMQRAVQFEPNNTLYRTLLSQFRRSEQYGSSPFGSAWSGSSGYSGSSDSNGSDRSGNSGPRGVVFRGGCLWRMLIFWFVMSMLTRLFSCGNPYYYNRSYTNTVPYGYYYTVPSGGTQGSGSGK